MFSVHMWRWIIMLLSAQLLVSCYSSSSDYNLNVTLFTPSVCASGTVQSNDASGFVFIQSSAPQSEKPLLGISINEPAYGLCLTRITQAATQPPDTFVRTDYSRRQASNADGSRMLTVAGDGAWHLYDPRVPAHVEQLSDFAGAVEPQWHATDPNSISYLPDAGARMQVLDLNLQSRLPVVAGDLGTRLQVLWRSAAHMNTGSEGSPSADGRLWAFQISNAAEAGLGLIVWDKLTDSIISHRNIQVLPNHLSMSPSGQHVVVSWDDRTVAYDRQLKNPKTLLHSSEHSDLAIGADGQDYYVSIDHNSQNGDLFMTDLATGQRTRLLGTYLNGGSTTLHVSGKAYDMPGWVVVSTFDLSDENPQWFYQRLWLIQMQANPRIYPLGFHQSKLQPAAGFDNYWAEPHATINRDGTLVVFNSNWNSNIVTDVDVYAIAVPPIDVTPSINESPPQFP